MKPDPISRQRSEWKPYLTPPYLAGADGWRRNVHDGTLLAFVADEPYIGWHLSISHRRNGSGTPRYPTWDEQVHAVRSLLPLDRTYAMLLPPDAEYVAVHQTTFHWHEMIDPRGRA